MIFTSFRPNPESTAQYCLPSSVSAPPVGRLPTVVNRPSGDSVTPILGIVTRDWVVVTSPPHRPGIVTCVGSELVVLTHAAIDINPRTIRNGRFMIPALRPAIGVPHRNRSIGCEPVDQFQVQPRAARPMTPQVSAGQQAVGRGQEDGSPRTGRHRHHARHLRWGGIRLACFIRVPIRFMGRIAPTPRRRPSIPLGRDAGRGFDREVQGIDRLGSADRGVNDDPMRYHRGRLRLEDAMNKVVAHFTDGRILKGFTNDFVPAKDHFHVTTVGVLGGPKSLDILRADLKALFFVKDFKGDPKHADVNTFDSSRPSAGRKIRVLFEDGEILVGTTQGYQPGRPGLFVEPADHESNILRCYVVSTATTEISFL